MKYLKKILIASFFICVVGCTSSSDSSSDIVTLSDAEESALAEMNGLGFAGGEEL